MGSLAKLFTKGVGRGARRKGARDTKKKSQLAESTTDASPPRRTGFRSRYPQPLPSSKPSDMPQMSRALASIPEAKKNIAAKQTTPARKAPPKPMARTPKAGKMQGAYNAKKAELQKLQAKAKNLSKGPKLTAIKEQIQLVTNAMEGIAKRNPSIKRNKGGKVLYKKHGGMSHVGLSPAEEARSGTMSEAKRARYMQGGGPIHTTFPEKAVPREKVKKSAAKIFPEVGKKAAEGGYLKDIKSNTTWEQFKKKHPDARITKKGFEVSKKRKTRSPEARGPSKGSQLLTLDRSKARIGRKKVKEKPTSLDLTKYKYATDWIRDLKEEREGAYLGGGIRTKGGVTYKSRSQDFPGGKPRKDRLEGNVDRQGGGEVLKTKKKKKKQDYKDRKDESIAQRVKKKRTPKQLKASRRESYGKPGSGKGKGKINRISSKQTNGNDVIAAIYAS